MIVYQHNEMTTHIDIYTNEGTLLGYLCKEEIENNKYAVRHPLREKICRCILNFLRYLSYI